MVKHNIWKKNVDQALDSSIYVKLLILKVDKIIDIFIIVVIPC